MKLTIGRAALPVLALVCGAAATTVPPELPRIEAPLPVGGVTVFSDRARVLRTGAVTLEASTTRVRLPLLPSSIDLDSIRLEATGARVVRVEVTRAERGEFPRGEARTLLETLERLRDEERTLNEQLAVLLDERKVLASVRPGSTPLPDAKGQPVLLDPTGWKISLAFFDDRSAALSDRVAPLEQALRDKEREIAFASERASQIAAGERERPGIHVEALLEGRGKALLSLRYMAPGARWYPTYDVRYAPGEGQVDVDFSALVSQETGEDWANAPLVLSTAIPATAASLPKLAVWKIGDRDRFIPTPVAEYQPPLGQPPRPPPPPIPLADERERERDESLRSALAEAADLAPPVAMAQRGRKMASHPMAPPPPSMADKDSYDDAPSAPQESFAGLAVQGELSAAESRSVARTSSSRGAEKPRQSISFGAPRGWVPPSYAGDLPAALAGGYDFTFTSARPESIASGAQARRIALRSQRFPAEAIVRILPALSKDAFLVAEIRNDGPQPLLMGRANLFVGADLVGEAVLPTTASGEKLSLPLGIDEAIRVERNVQVVASQRGFFSKEEVGAYEVVIEVMNPRARTVKAVIVDQLPRTQDEHVKVALDKADPMVVPDKDEGLVEWKLDLPSGVKRRISFTYSVARPKGSKLRQYVTPMGGR